ncbi:MAG: hypothetical protein ACXABY_30820 [Candidatus Thorarchaeota archaeon]|jgi:hypothetical protein
MQKLSMDLAFLLGGRKHFKIKFRQYDTGTHIFYPCYEKPSENVTVGDIVAWLWSDSLKFGCVNKVYDEHVRVTLITRKYAQGVQVMFSPKDILCIFKPC